MIFESVNHITDKSDFLEKILIYIRLVEVFAERMGFSIPAIDEITNEIEKELINIGMVNESSELPLLKTFLKKEYTRFIDCVSFSLVHKKEMGDNYI